MVITMTTGETIEVQLARIEGKLDVALAGVSDHEQRIRKLERAVWGAAGAGLLAGGFAGSVASTVLGG